MATTAPPPQTIPETYWAQNNQGSSGWQTRQVPNPAYTAWAAANSEQASLMAQLQTLGANYGQTRPGTGLDPYSSQIWGEGTGRSGVSQATINGKTYYYVPNDRISTGGSEGTAVVPTGITPFGTFNYTTPGSGGNAGTPKTGSIYDVDPFTDLSTYKPGTGGDFIKSDLVSLAPLAIAGIAAAAIPAAAGAGASAAGSGGAAAGTTAGGLGGGSGTVGSAFGAGGTGVGGGLGGASTVGGTFGTGGALGGGLSGAAGVGATGLTATELAGMGGLELPAGTAASGAGSSLGGLSTAEAASGAGGLMDVMPGANAAASGATGGIGASSSGGLGGLLQGAMDDPMGALGGLGKWALDNPQLASAVIGGLGSLFGGSGGSGGGGSGGGGGGSPGLSLPTAAPLNRTPNPVSGDLRQYGKSAMPVQHQFFNNNAIPHASGGEIVSPLQYASGQLVGPGGGRDDLIDAKVADGEYILSADVVAALGDGSNEEGSRKLDDAVAAIRAHRNKGKGELPPRARSPLEYFQ